MYKGKDILSEEDIVNFQRKEDISRVDPAGCGCTDCIVGEWSRPVDMLSDEQLVRFIRGEYDDASMCDKDEVIQDARDRGLVAE